MNNLLATFCLHFTRTYYLLGACFLLGTWHHLLTPAFALVFPKYTFYVPNPCILGARPVLPCKNGSSCKLTGGTVIPVSLIAVVPTILKKSVFCGYLAVASVSLGLPTQFVRCCLAATRAFMPASLIVIPYTILEISKFLGQLPVDDDNDEKCQLNAGIALLRSKLSAWALNRAGRRRRREIKYCRFRFASNSRASVPVDRRNTCACVSSNLR